MSNKGFKSRVASIPPPSLNRVKMLALEIKSILLHYPSKVLACNLHNRSKDLTI